jgi:hypothetical protein
LDQPGALNCSNPAIIGSAAKVYNGAIQRHPAPRRTYRQSAMRTYIAGAAATMINETRRRERQCTGRRNTA